MSKFNAFALIALLSSTNVGSEMKMIDEEKLLQYRKNTTVAGVYLTIWKIVDDHLRKSSQFRWDEYVVSFDEDDKLFHLKLNKPFKEPVLGGGVGTCTVDKKTHDVQCKLIR